MTFNYTALQTSAGSLLQNFGRQLTFTRTTDGAYDPNTGTTSPTTSTFTKYGCVFEYSDSERGDQTIEEGDRRVLAEGHTYQVGDKVSLDSETYRIISVSNIQPAGTIVACNLQVRK
tara:strand:+ start:1785 stop:2135 length:351 start_codon:yes stop_codon:yes gene_type:complete